MNNTVEIAMVMVWTKGDNSTEMNTLEYWDDVPESAKMMVAKSLQQRMVDDGWYILIEHDYDGFAISAMHPDQHEDWPQVFNMSSEPAAIVALFCRVYGIPIEGKDEK